MTDSCDRLVARGHWGEDEQLHRCHWPIGPRNAWSNVAYAVTGVIPFWLHRSPEAFLFLLAMLALCYGSFRYHAEKTIRANLLDRVGMFLVLVPLASLGVTRLLPWPIDPGIAMVLPALVLTPLAVYYLPLKWMDAQIGLLVLLGSIGGVLRGDAWITAGALSSFTGGYACWHLDKDPRRPLGLWGHAIWHLLTALAFALLFLGITS